MAGSVGAAMVRGVPAGMGGGLLLAACAAGVMLSVALSVALGVALGVAPRPPPPLPVLWAWERPEDLRFAGDGVAVAILAGTITLSGDAAVARPRLQPARVAPGQPLIGTVHVEIDRSRRLLWTDAQRAAAVAAALSLLDDLRFGEAQVDFEVRASERGVLLDLLRGVRAASPPGRLLSMTALASWCDTEHWLDEAPVDDVVPMLFRTGRGGAALRDRLAAGGDFGPRCRRSVGAAADTPLPRPFPGRRTFLFNPAPWTADSLDRLRQSLGLRSLG